MIENKKASILVLAIWVLVVFSIMAGVLYSLASSHLRLSQAVRRRAVSNQMAVAAANYVRGYLLNAKNPMDVFIVLRVHEQELGRGKYYCQVKDEESKININIVKTTVLGRLPGVNSEIQEQILKARPLQSKESLLSLEGVTEEIYKSMEPLVTIYGKGAVNINTASDEVFKVLGMDDDLIRMIDSYRNGSDGILGTEDDGLFEKKSGIMADLQPFGLYAKQQATLIELSTGNLLDVSGDIFTLYIDTEFLGKPVSQYAITLDESGVMQWQEYQRRVNSE